MTLSQAFSRAIFTGFAASSLNTTIETGVKPAVKSTLTASFVTAALALTSGSALTLAIASKGDRDQAAALLSAVPRTCRALGWLVRSLAHYSYVSSSYSGEARDQYEIALEEVHQLRAQALLNLCQKNGSLYIKAAQQLSLVPAIPKIYRKTLEVLQDRVVSRPYAEIEHVLQQELQGRPVSDVFSVFQPQAVAAASLAQVHKARLRSNGEQVAVKLQYPGLEAAVASDLATFAGLTALVGVLYRDLQFRWIVDDLRGQIYREIDFRQEAANARAFALATQGHSGVHVPEVYSELSSARMLTMEWVDGVKVNDKAALKRLGLRDVEVGQLLLQTFSDMAFCRGIIHADPHPGNILVRVSPSRHRNCLSRLFRGRHHRKPQLLLLDHGHYIVLGDPLRHQYCQLWSAFMLNDTDTAKEVATRIGGDKLGFILPLILKPGALDKLSKEQKDDLRAKSGIAGLSDMSELVEMMPRPLAQYIRVSGIIRQTAFDLGCLATDRLRISAGCAAKGMRVGKGVYMKSLDSKTKRMELRCRIFFLRCVAWTSQWWHFTVHRVQAAV